MQSVFERFIGPGAVPLAVGLIGLGAGLAGEELEAGGRERRSLAPLSNLIHSWTNSLKVSGGEAWYKRAVLSP